jgi:O-antigen ligase
MNFNEVFFFKIPSILLIFLPVFLITGSFLPDFSVSWIALSFLVYSIKYKDFRFFKNIFFKIFIIFYFFIVFSSLLSSNFLYSLKTSIFYIRFGVFAVAIWFLLLNKKNLYKYLLISLSLCFLALTIDSLIQEFSGYNIFGYDKISIGYGISRISSFFGKELILGSYCFRLFPLFIGLLFLIKINNRYKKILIFSSLFFIFLLILLSGERASFFLFVIYLILFFFLIKDFRKLIFYFLLLLTIILIFFIKIDSPKSYRIFNVTINQFINTDKEISNRKFFIFSRDHDSHYRTAINMFIDNKFFGVGPKNFRNECSNIKYYVNEFSCSTHPHNTYIQLLAETGFFGFLFIFFLFLFLVYVMSRHVYYILKKNFYYFSNTQLSFLLCLFINLWPFAPTGNFFSNYLNVFYYFGFSLFLWSISDLKNSKLLFKNLKF